MQDDPPEDEPEESHSENSDTSGIIEEEIKSTDVGSSESEIHYGTKRFLQAFFPFAECWFSGGVKAWDVDLGEFLNDIEDDPDAATMLGTANDFELDAELEDDIEDAFFPNNEFELDAEPNEIDLDLEESSQDELEDKDHLMPFFSLFACVILMVICAGFLISMFLGYV